MPFTRWEFLLYNFVAIVPFIVLLLLSFKNHLRYGVGRSVIIAAPFVAAWSSFQFAAIYNYLPWIGLADVISPFIVIALLESLVFENLVVNPLFKIPQRKFKKVHLQKLLRCQRLRKCLFLGLYESLCHETVSLRKYKSSYK